MPRANAETVAAAFRTIFAQSDASSVADQFGRIVVTLDTQLGDVVAMLIDVS